MEYYIDVGSKKSYYAASFIGSIVGGYIPSLWGADFLSFSVLILSTIGGLLGILIVYKLSQ